VRKLTTLLAVALGLMVPVSATAQEKKKTDDGVTVDDDGVRRDPAGHKGISPYEEELAAGRDAFGDGQHDDAIAAFKRAIAKDDTKLDAYLLISQVQLVKGDRDAALKTLTKARGKRATEGVQAKVLIFRADVLEREANLQVRDEKAAGGLSDALKTAWDKSKEAWTAYAAFLDEHTRVKGYKPTADERKKQIDARQQREKDLAPVRTRMAADLAKKN